MCTVTWMERPGGYDLLCNRDEKRNRAIAEPPAVIDRGGLRYIAPRDVDGGGTWIAVNEYGLTLCLLNATPRPGRLSRGLVIPDLIWARSADDCRFLFSHLDLSPFAPFTLLMIEPGSPARIAEWDGSGREVRAAVAPILTSSSYEPDAVRAERLAEFTRRDPSDPQALFRFHASHAGSSGAYAPCMHRADAETVSFSHVTVAGGDIRFEYLPAAPCVRNAWPGVRPKAAVEIATASA